MNFEFPYNFDFQLIDILKVLDPEGETINCIYLPPYIQDYQTILRSGEQADFLFKLSRFQYEEHIKYIRQSFPKIKIQILLQNPQLILKDQQILNYYINKLKINNFCVGNIAQAKEIKKIDPTINIVGSITMNNTLENIQKNFIQYKQFFNSFVLPFSLCRDLEQIKKLPKNFQYILLINGYCNVKCMGKQHWFSSYNKEEEIFCPGILVHNNLKWENTTRIRPMDLFIFQPYISVFKLQDRGWPTDEIIKDYILYTSDYSFYPEINYTERIYNK